MSLPYTAWEDAAVTARPNAILRCIEDLGSRWHISFDPHKTQLLLVSTTTNKIQLTFNTAMLIP